MVGVAERKNMLADGVAERARSWIGSGTGSEICKVERMLASFFPVGLSRMPESRELKRLRGSLVGSGAFYE